MTKQQQKEKKCAKQLATNKTLFSMLIAYGDNPEAIRPVEHFSYFRHKAHLEAYENMLKKAGIKCRRTKCNTGVILTVNSIATESELNQQTKDFCCLTMDHDGDYDGWEITVIEKSK